MICDAAIIFLTSVFSGVAYHLTTIGTKGDIAQFVGFAAIVCALFIALGKIYNAYDLPKLLNFKSEIRDVVVTWTLVFLFLTAVAFITKLGDSFSRGAVLSFAACGLLGIITGRGFWRICLAGGLAVRKFSNRQVALIADASANGEAIRAALARHGLQPTYQFTLPDGASNKKRRKEFMADAISALRGSDVEEIVVSASLNGWPELSPLLAELRVLPLPVNLVPVGHMSELLKLPSHTIGDNITIELQRGPRTALEQTVKRVLDLVIACAAIVFLFPVFCVTAIAIRLDSPGPIFFRQWRRGFNGRPFQILKFRTMKVLEDGENIVQAIPNDSRVTFVGRVLRRTSIDELPQLINVLQGSMSIVGPRPHAMAHDTKFDKTVAKYAYRQHVKPGITGWAQVNGYRGHTPTISAVEKRIQLDLWYINNWSLAVDLKILFMTAGELVAGKNAY